jgi:arylsulfatase A-like enzyme
VVAKPVCQTDIFATIESAIESLSGQSTATNQAASSGEDSESFLETFRDPKATVRQSAMIHHSSNGQFAVRKGKWKLVMPRGEGTAALFDLDADIGETKNLAAQAPEVTERLTKLLTDAVLQGRSTPGPKASNDTDYWDDLTWITAEQYTASHADVSRSE